VKFDPAVEWLVVCTQTCSMCSEDFTAEPMAEIMVATPLQKFNSKHNDAMGKNNKCLHVPVASLPGLEGLACHIGRRTFMSRSTIAGWVPSKAWMAEEVEKSFRGWLAHHYMRISLPDKLVERLKEPDGVRDIINAALEGDVLGKPSAEGVASFYVSSKPDHDLPPDQPYQMELLVACKNEETREFLTRVLSDLHAAKKKDLSVKGVVITRLDIETEDNITLSALEGMHRFNEWDTLSLLPERLASIEKTI